MARRPKIARTLPVLRREIARWRAAGATVALVPTMGALHDGHLALVRLAQRRADRVVVSIFVNPAQFAPAEDFSTYPRTFEADAAALSEEKADLIWAPESVEAMYPKGFATHIVPDGPATAGLEDAFRPDFFKGVATVVAKLFIQTMPDIAVFGEKDYQQLLVIKQLVRDLNIPVQIVSGPIVREGDGLALSSRNFYLSAAERMTAPILHQVLSEVAAALANGEGCDAASSAGRFKLEANGFRVDYVAIRDPETLAPLFGPISGPARVMGAVYLGTTRLIDNLPTEPKNR
jgi:pantoate--beta-alanine ligase